MERQNTVVRTEYMYAIKRFHELKPKKGGNPGKENFTENYGRSLDWNRLELRTNNEVYQKVERTSETKGKRKLTFLGYLYRLDKIGLTKPLFDTSGIGTAVVAVKEARKDLDRSNIHEAQMSEKAMFRSRIRKFEGFHMSQVELRRPEVCGRKNKGSETAKVLIRNTGDRRNYRQRRNEIRP